MVSRKLSMANAIRDTQHVVYFHNVLLRIVARKKPGTLGPWWPELCPNSMRRYHHV